MGNRIARRKIKRLTITFSDGIVEHSGTSSDFSMTGLFIRTRKALPPGTNLKIVVVLDDQRTITLMGIVVRSIKTGSMDIKNGMGVKFTYIPKEYEDFMNELLKP